MLGTVSEVVAVLGLIAVVLTNAGVAFYWGGRISKAINLLEKITDDHEGRIRELERFGP